MDSSVRPIIELVNSNNSTKISLDKYVEAMMPFVLIANPQHGDFKGKEQSFYDEFVTRGSLSEYDHYVPALRVDRDTGMAQVKKFLKNYDASPFRAVVYNGQPISETVLHWLSTDDRIYHQIIIDGCVTADFVSAIPKPRRVMIRDNFHRKLKNADYPEIPELFTDMNTASGNPEGIDWGDYSIQGDHFTEGGGQAHAVAIHHVHYSDSGMALYVSHFLSERRNSTADTPGKAIEAVENLVRALDDYEPNQTEACEEYRKILAADDAGGLGYLKRVAMLHHLEVLLENE